MADKSTRIVGVLAYRFPRNVQTNHSIHGSGLLISQPIQLTEDVALRFEDDFVTIPSGSNTQPAFSTSPASLCDLLIASRCVYESVSGLGRDIKAKVLSKWLSKSETTISDLLPQLYRWNTYPKHYREYLVTSYTQLDLQPNLTELKEGLERIALYANRAEPGRDGYQAILFTPLRKVQYKPLKHPRNPSQTFPVSLLSDCQYELKRRLVSSCAACPHLRNLPTEVNLIIPHEGGTYRALETQFDCLATKLSAIPLLYTLYPSERLQRLIGIDAAHMKAFYSLGRGTRLLDVRVRGLRNNPVPNGRMQAKESHRFERWLLSIHGYMAQDQIDAYRASWRAPGKWTGKRPICSHPLYQELEKSCWIEDPSLRLLASQNQMSVHELIGLPIFINGHCYGSLRDRLAEATKLLDPYAAHFQRSVTAFGLGGLHAGKVLVDEDRIGKGSRAVLTYTDYSHVGYHSPVIDMASSLYIDCFFPVLFADTEVDLTCHRTAGNGMHLNWSISDKGIAIENQVNMSSVDRSIAISKLEYVVRPTFAMLDAQQEDAMTDRHLREQILGHTMLVSALTTKNFQQGPDAFLLNLSLGVRLASDPGQVLQEAFGWDIQRGLVDSAS